MDISDGEGIGVALFVQGCHFHCYNCFNPETWDFNKGKEWTKQTEKLLINLMYKDYIQRLSILGGEPLASENLSTVLEIVNKIHVLFPEKRIWLYTGYTWESIFPSGVNQAELSQEEITRQEVVKSCNILIDGRYVDEQRDITLKWRGSKNQRVINVQGSLLHNSIVLYTD